MLSSAAFSRQQTDVGRASVLGSSALDLGFFCSLGEGLFV